MHPDLFLPLLTDEQWQENLAYYNLEPFGPPVDDARHGIQCAVTIAPHLKKGEKADPTRYMVRPPDEAELPEMTPTATLDFFCAVAPGGVRTS